MSSDFETWTCAPCIMTFTDKRALTAHLDAIHRGIAAEFRAPANPITDGELNRNAIGSIIKYRWPTEAEVDRWNAMQQAFRKVRATAIEEAAKLVETGEQWSEPPDGVSIRQHIADSIRALSSGPKPTTSGRIQMAQELMQLGGFAGIGKLYVQSGTELVKEHVDNGIGSIIKYQASESNKSQPVEAKCECGATACRSNIHSEWCPAS